MRTRGWLLVVGSALLLAAAVYVLPLVVFIVGMGECGFDLKDQQVSPDGLRKAAVVEVNCGATTDYATWVVMTKADRPFRYRADFVAAIKGQDADIEWDGSKLVIFYPRARLPNLNKEHRGDVILRTLQSHDADRLLKPEPPAHKASS